MKKGRVARCSRWSKKSLKSFPTTPHKNCFKLYTGLKIWEHPPAKVSKRLAFHTSLFHDDYEKYIYIIPKCAENLLKKKKLKKNQKGEKKDKSEQKESPI